MIDKSQLVTALVQQLEVDLDLQMRAAMMARDEATNAESRAKSKWDTRGQEAAYLAAGQAKLAEELGHAIAVYRTMTLPDTRPPARLQVGSVCTIECAGGNLHGFIGPRTGGTQFVVADVTYTVVTPASPLGRAVLDHRAGETVYLVARGKPQPHRIVATF
ncbi:MAG: transcription elongation factor [Candidatus Synoicihabitans palmerolidicus]|nr:transcription elongation factor [Candidatus Synoicihabitans palmerolidicus]